MIKKLGVERIDQATAEIAVALRDANPGRRDQSYYNEAMRLRDEILSAVAGEARYHSADDMHKVRALRDVTDPVAVLVQRDGSLDVYGWMTIVDQRPGRSG